MPEVITHVSPQCPLLKIDLDWGTVLIEDVGLSVEVVKDNNPVTLKKIKSIAMGICASCLNHFLKPPGTCKPGGHIWPSTGDIAGSTILVNQREDIPSQIKNNIKYDYSDF
ncbi:MAG: hypothetical protein AAB705_02970 [Patescibacteria group bacterium]